MEFVTGERVIVEVQFRDRGAASDPALAACYVRHPSGKLERFAYGPGQDIVSRRGTGLFEAGIVLDEAGLWAFRWEGAGDVDAVAEQTLHVRASAVFQNE